MTAFPLRYARRNVLIGPGGQAAALYRAELLALMPLGRALVEMAELEKIPDADKHEIGAELRGTLPRA